jgi:hypothetical protein
LPCCSAVAGQGQRAGGCQGRCSGCWRRRCHRHCRRRQCQVRAACGGDAEAARPSQQKVCARRPASVRIPGVPQGSGSWLGHGSRLCLSGYVDRAEAAALSGSFVMGAACGWRASRRIEELQKREASACAERQRASEELNDALERLQQQSANVEADAAQLEALAREASAAKAELAAAKQSLQKVQAEQAKARLALGTPLPTPGGGGACVQQQPSASRHLLQGAPRRTCAPLGSRSKSTLTFRRRLSCTRLLAGGLRAPPVDGMDAPNPQMIPFGWLVAASCLWPAGNAAPDISLQAVAVAVTAAVADATVTAKKEAEVSAAAKQAAADQQRMRDLEDQVAAKAAELSGADGRCARTRALVFCDDRALHAVRDRSARGAPEPYSVSGACVCRAGCECWSRRCARRCRRRSCWRRSCSALRQRARRRCRGWPRSSTRSAQARSRLPPAATPRSTRWSRSWQPRRRCSRRTRRSSSRRAPRRLPKR